MKKILLTLGINMLSIFAINYLFSGITIDDGKTLLILAIVLGLLNATIKPILNVLSLPITILSFGIFSLVINAIILSLTFNFVAGASIDSFGTTFFASIVLMICNSILNSVLES